MKSISELIDRRLLWRGEESDHADADPTLCELFAKGSVHQIFSCISSQASDFHAPVALPLTIARQQVKNDDLRKKVFVFIGRECFPSIYFLRDCFSLKNKEAFKNFIYLNVNDEKSKCWALERALSSTNVLCVMASINTLSFSLSRRFSLLAEKNGAICFLFPTKNNTNVTNAVRARWKLETQKSDCFATDWSIALVHIKGAKTKRTIWKIRLAHEKEISIDLLPELVSESYSVDPRRRARA